MQETRRVSMVSEVHSVSGELTTINHEINALSTILTSLSNDKYVNCMHGIKFNSHITFFCRSTVVAQLDKLKAELMSVQHVAEVSKNETLSAQSEVWLLNPKALISIFKLFIVSLHSSRVSRKRKQNCKETWPFYENNSRTHLAIARM